MSRTFRTAMLLAAALLAGCKTKQADPPPAARPTEMARSAPGAPPALPDSPAGTAAPAAAPATPAEAQARNIVAMQHLADTLADDAQDCEKVAVDLKAFIAENRAALAQLMAAANRPVDDAPTGANRAAAAAAARKLQTAMTTCAATSSVAAAMKDLPGP
ncbi:MAG TPA: hypothetical protein VHT91_17880 [Kofleriaceae bacterium]|jgi:hypothetical protein|nr:hypothetical protein [Kofleriaceae bacterium]